MLLALLDNSIAAILVVQALLAGLTVFLTGLVGNRLFQPRTGLIAAGLLAIDIPSVFYSGMVMSEVLFVFMVVLAAAFGLGGTKGPADSGWTGKSSRRAAVAGLSLGLAALVRPVGLLMVLPFALAPAWKRDWRGLVVMLVAFLLLPAAWSARNYRYYSRFAFTSIGDYNLLYANAATLVGDEQHISPDSARSELARVFTSRLATDNPLLLGDAMALKAASIIVRDPLRYAWLCLRDVPKVVAGIKSDDMVLRMRRPEVANTQVSILAQRTHPDGHGRLVIWALVALELLTALGGFALAFVSLVFSKGRPDKMVLVAIGLCFVVIALPLTDGRFRMPAMPFVYLAAATVLARREPRGGVEGS